MPRSASPPFRIVVKDPAAAPCDHYGTYIQSRGAIHRQEITAGEDDKRWLWQQQAGGAVTGNIEFPYQAPPLPDAWLSAEGSAVGANH